jgi:hypothetical protein
MELPSGGGTGSLSLIPAYSEVWGKAVFVAVAGKKADSSSGEVGTKPASREFLQDTETSKGELTMKPASDRCKRALGAKIADPARREVGAKAAGEFLHNRETSKPELGEKGPSVSQNPAVGAKSASGEFRQI